MVFKAGTRLGSMPDGQMLLVMVEGRGGYVDLREEVCVCVFEVYVCVWGVCVRDYNICLVFRIDKAEYKHL